MKIKFQVKISKYGDSFRVPTLEGYNFQLVKLMGIVALWVCRGYICLEIHPFRLPESHRRWLEWLLEVGLRDRQFWILGRQFRGANFEGSYLLIQRVFGKSALMVSQRVCRGRERWSYLAGKPPDGGVTTSGSWLVREDFSAAGRRARRAGTPIKTAPGACVLTSARPAAGSPAGDWKISSLVPGFLCNCVLTLKLN